MVLQHLYYKQMRDHCKESENLTPAAFDTIDWDTIKDSTNSSPELFNLWMSKQISGFCPVGKNMQQWGFWEDSQCHSCDEPSDETSVSVPMKTDKMNGKKQPVDGLEAWMIDANTDPMIQYCIIPALQMQNPNSSFSTYANACSNALFPLSPLTITAAQEQDNIGLQHFLKGRVSAKRSMIQDAYYRSIGSQCSSCLWAEDFVSNILTLIHHQWKARNAIVHARDELGLKVQAGQELEMAVNTHL